MRLQTWNSVYGEAKILLADARIMNEVILYKLVLVRKVKACGLVLISPR